MDTIVRILLLLSVALSTIGASTVHTPSDSEGCPEESEDGCEEEPPPAIAGLFGVIFMLAGAGLCINSVNGRREYEKELNNLRANGVKVDAVVCQHFTERKSHTESNTAYTIYWIVIAYTVRTELGRSVNISKKKLEVNSDEYERLLDGQTVKVIAHKEFPKWAMLESELEKNKNREEACLRVGAICFGGFFIAAGVAVTVLILSFSDEDPTLVGIAAVVIFFIGLVGIFKMSKKCVQHKIHLEKNDANAVEMLDQS